MKKITFRKNEPKEEYRRKLNSHGIILLIVMIMGFEALVPAVIMLLYLCICGLIVLYSGKLYLNNDISAILLVWSLRINIPIAPIYTYYLFKKNFSYPYYDDEDY